MITELAKIYIWQVLWREKLYRELSVVKKYVLRSYTRISKTQRHWREIL